MLWKPWHVVLYLASITAELDVSLFLFCRSAVSAQILQFVLLSAVSVHLQAWLGTAVVLAGCLHWGQRHPVRSGLHYSASSKGNRDQLNFGDVGKQRVGVRELLQYH